LHDTWLTIPQAVVLEVTGDLQLARDLDDDDPNRLMIKAILRLPPLISLDIDAFPNIEAARQQWRALVGSQVEESAYENGLRRVRAKLIEGVTIKGSRASNRPLEVIDRAEVARLEFRGIDAVDARTGEPVWYHLVISARELLDGNSERAGRTGDSEGVARADTPLVWTREETAPIIRSGPTLVVSTANSGLVGMGQNGFGRSRLGGSQTEISWSSYKEPGACAAERSGT